MSQTIRRLVLVRQLQKDFSFRRLRFLRYIQLQQIFCLVKLIFFSDKRINAVGSSLESIPKTFSNAKSGYATVFAIFYLTSLVPPILLHFVLFAQQLSIQVAST